MDTINAQSSIQSKRQILLSIANASHLVRQSPSCSIVPNGHDWRDDWRAHLLEKSEEQGNRPVSS
ncbi:hypothetical protein VJ918_04480 [Adlercreutzia sp. R21]|nr:hypothetical protein [Adlercreutzia sp. R21]